jgi:hypothetical protein
MLWLLVQENADAPGFELRTILWRDSLIPLWHRTSRRSSWIVLLAIDFRIEMLEIVRHGGLTDCLEAAVEIIAADDEPDELKQYAVLAIGAFGNSEIRAHLARVVCANVKPPESPLRYGCPSSLP